MTDLKIQESDGFTLIEVVAVLIIVSIVSVVVVTRLWNTGPELIAATDVIKTHLRYAQSRAMSDNQIWGIYCDGNRYYWLYNSGNISNIVGLPGEDKDSEDQYRIDFTIYTDKDPRWRSISSIEAFTISFDERGIPHTDASATDGTELTSDHDYSQITVSSGSNSATITITPNTGFIP